MNLDRYFLSRNRGYERIALSQVLTTGKPCFELKPELFDGSERKLFDEIQRQWESMSSIDLAVLRENHMEVFTAALDNPGSLSSEVLSELTYHAQNRAIGAMIAQVQQIEDPKEALEKLQQFASDTILSGRQEGYDHRKAIQTLFEVIEKAARRENSISGYSTGIVGLDSLTSGIEKGKFYVIGALKKSGKSRFGVYLSIACAAAGARVIWNSLEMNQTQLNLLALSYYSGVDSRDIGRFLKKSQLQAIEQGTKALSTLGWCIVREYTLSELKSQLLFEKSKNGADVVFVDFIQRMQVPELRKDRVREVERLAQGLADMSRELDIAIIAFSQLSKDAENLEGEEMPNMSHFKESQGIPENADVIMTLHNTDRHKNPFVGNDYIPPIFKCLIEQRYDVSGAVVRIKADLRTCNFYDAPKEEENDGFGS